MGTENCSKKQYEWPIAYYFRLTGVGISYHLPQGYHQACSSVAIIELRDHTCV